MGVHKNRSTITGGVTPICNSCSVSLCWDIADEEYAEAPAFWDAWICEDCNDGQALSLKTWRAAQTAMGAAIKPRNKLMQSEEEVDR